MYLLATVLSLVTIPVLVISQQCGPLDHKRDTSIDMTVTNLVVLAQIENTTQKHCYRSCCSMLETDGCNTVIFDKRTHSCTLISCEDNNYVLINDNNSVTTTVGIYNETTTTSTPTSTLLSNTELTSSSKLPMNITITKPITIPTSIDENNNPELTNGSSMSERTTSATLNNQLITTTSAFLEEADSSLTNITEIKQNSPPLDQAQDSSNRSESIITTEEHISVVNSSSLQEATTNVSITSAPEPSQLPKTAFNSANLTLTSEKNVTLTNSSNTNITSTVPSIKKPTMTNFSNESLQTTTVLSSDTNTRIVVNSKTTSTPATSNLSNTVLINVTPANENVMPNSTTTITINTINVTSEINKNMSSNGTSQEVTDTISLNISTTPTELYTMNGTTQPFNSNHTTAVEATSNYNHSEDSKASPVNSTLFQPQNHHFISPDDQLPALLVAALSVGIIFIFVIFVLLGKRVFDSWQRRHYSRVDYLINGMYN